MTAIIVSTEDLPNAITVCGDQFTVRLSANGDEPVTHFGCNWVNCPEELVSELAEISGITLGKSWEQTCASAGVQVINPDAPAD